MKQPLPVHVGQRNVKTALSASLCALIYYFLGRNPAFACIGAIFGMGADMEHSRLHGGNRLFGTVIGGFLGIGIYRIYLIFYPDGDTTCCWCPCSSGDRGAHHSGPVLLGGAVQPGGVVLCLLLFSIGPDNYVSYSLNRMLDTGVGVAMSLLINWALPGSGWSAGWPPSTAAPGE